MTENLSSLGINFGKIYEMPCRKTYGGPKERQVIYDTFETLREYEDKHMKLSDFLNELPVRLLVSVNNPRREMNQFSAEVQTKAINTLIRTSRKPGAPIEKGSYIIKNITSTNDDMCSALPFTIDTYIGGGRRKRTHKAKRHNHKTKRHHRC
jgi:hypothetical protein